jgi:2-phosphosulfolactate phosphatase
MQKTWFSQNGYRVKFDWGRHGVQAAAERGDVLVIVDTLCFSTTAVTAISRGAYIYPCAVDQNPVELAEQVGAELAVRREEVPHKGRFSLSPLTFLEVETGKAVVVASPNGATCSRYGSIVPYLLVGTLANARATAQAVAEILNQTDLNVTVIACGERWHEPNEDGTLRFAIEDYLGAGAILSYLDLPKSPEAQICEGAFLHSQADLSNILKNCGSGIELCDIGFGGDVEHAANLNLYDAVAILRSGRIEKL